MTRVVVVVDASMRAFWCAARAAPGPEDRSERRLWRRLVGLASVGFSGETSARADLLDAVEHYARTLPEWKAPYPWRVGGAQRRHHVGGGW